MSNSEIFSLVNDVQCETGIALDQLVAVIDMMCRTDESKNNDVIYAVRTLAAHCQSVFDEQMNTLFKAIFAENNT